MTEPVIICPNCEEEIKLTESLAAPLVEATRQQYETKLAKKESEISKREAAIIEKQIAVTAAERSLEEKVIARLSEEREKIAAEEAKRARLLFSDEIGRKGKEVTDLQEILKAREIKLAEAQKAQASVIRKQRELMMRNENWILRSRSESRNRSLQFVTKHVTKQKRASSSKLLRRNRRLPACNVR